MTCAGIARGAPAAAFSLFLASAAARAVERATRASTQGLGAWDVRGRRREDAASQVDAVSSQNDGSQGDSRD